MKRVVWPILLGAALTACGGSSSSGGGGVPQTVTLGMAFSPTLVSSIPGGSVIVQNSSGVNHTFTSEAAQGSFTPGGAGTPLVSFDTGAFQGTMTVNIPAGATVGTKVWAYCNIHKTAAEQAEVQIVAGGGGY
jgi:hypothetical protein